MTLALHHPLPHLVPGTIVQYPPAGALNRGHASTDLNAAVLFELGILQRKNVKAN